MYIVAGDTAYNTEHIVGLNVDDDKIIIAVDIGENAYTNIVFATPDDARTAYHKILNAINRGDRVCRVQVKGEDND